MFCYKCGKELDNQARFCTSCGTKVGKDAVYKEYFNIKKSSILFYIICVLTIFIMVGGWLETFTTNGGYYRYEDSFSLWGFKFALEKMDSWGIEIQSAVESSSLAFAERGLKLTTIASLFGGILFIGSWLNGRKKLSLITTSSISTLFGAFTSVTMIIALVIFNGGDEKWEIIELTTVGKSLVIAPLVNIFLINMYEKCLKYEDEERI